MYDSLIDQLKMPLVLQCYANGLDPVKEGLLVEGVDFDDPAELDELKKEASTLEVMTKISRKIQADNKDKMFKALKHAGFCGDDALKLVARMDCNVLTLSGNG